MRRLFMVFSLCQCTLTRRINDVQGRALTDAANYSTPYALFSARGRRAASELPGSEHNNARPGCGRAFQKSRGYLALVVNWPTELAAWVPVPSPCPETTEK